MSGVLTQPGIDDLLSTPAGPRWHVVHMITRFVNGGADENTLLCCNAAAERGHRVELWSGPDVAPEIRRRLDPRVSLSVIGRLVRPVDPLADVIALADLVVRLRRCRPDIVHTHTSKAGILGRLAARMTGVRAIVHGVHIAPFERSNKARFAYLKAERLVAPMTHAYVHVSSALRDLYVDVGLGASERHHVVRSGMLLMPFRRAEPRADWRAILQTDVEVKPPVILMLAAYETRKRHRELIEALLPLMARRTDVRLVLAGGGSIPQDLVHRSRNGRVIWLGHQANPAGLVALADVAVHCASREGLPRVVVQYLAAGVPVVATALPGLEEVLIDGCNGLIVGQNDFARLAASIEDVLENRRLRTRLAAGAAATDLSAWDLAAMDEDIEQIHRCLMEERS